MTMASERDALLREYAVCQDAERRADAVCTRLQLHPRRMENAIWNLYLRAWDTRTRIRRHMAQLEREVWGDNLLYTPTGMKYRLPRTHITDPSACGECGGTGVRRHYYLEDGSMKERGRCPVCKGTCIAPTTSFAKWVTREAEIMDALAAEDVAAKCADMDDYFMSVADQRYMGAW